MSLTNYDPIAEQYQRSKQQPWRTFIECHTLMNLVGDPQGLWTLDVACGEGFYTRLLRTRGASPVAGVDLSQGMIELAQKQEDRHRLGIEYRVGDARELNDVAPGDLTVSAYLLNYARDRNELQAMCDGIARSLKAGGRFVTVNCSPLLEFPAAPSYREFGFETSVVGPWQEGAPIQWKFYLGDTTFELENYHLSVATHEECLRGAGFREVRWHAPQLSPDAGAEVDWSTFLNASPVAFIECIK